MLHSGVLRGAGASNPSSAAVMPAGAKSAKPYAVMEFEGLLATALSNQSLDALKEFPGGTHSGQRLQQTCPPALPLAPPSETLAQWKRARYIGRGPSEIRTSPHHVPKSSSDGGLLRRAYLDVTQPHFSNEFPNDHQAPNHQRHALDRLQRSDVLRQDKSAAHTHGGFIHANIRSPTSTTLRTPSPWSSVDVSRRISPRSLQNIPSSNFPPDIVPRYLNDKPLWDPHPDLSPWTRGHRVPDPASTDSPQVSENGATRAGRPGALHIPMDVNGTTGGALPHASPGHTPNGAFSKSFRTAGDNPSLSNVSLNINSTGSSSSPGSLFSSPPSRLNYSGISNGNSGGDNGILSYFAHSPFAETGSGNTSTTLSDGPIPIVSLLQVRKEGNVLS
ncbi:hypothetical protein EGW08_018438 [Elysia chlorotica]|uniref:Uncharacterized protein n=1 Tax=Elysia chlorotica TaxID=188477 RepID=A0A433SX11_ELYCH|nr:hypothetical protein EGW08_018438 [Elysia chlorotica]